MEKIFHADVENVDPTSELSFDGDLKGVTPRGRSALDLAAQLVDLTERANIAINRLMEVISALRADNARLEAEVSNLQAQIERMESSEVAP
jgi:hypothetical protein